LSPVGIPQAPEDCTLEKMVKDAPTKKEKLAIKGS